MFSNSSWISDNLIPISVFAAAWRGTGVVGKSQSSIVDLVYEFFLALWGLVEFLVEVFMLSMLFDQFLLEFDRSG